MTYKCYCTISMKRSWSSDTCSMSISSAGLFCSSWLAIFIWGKKLFTCDKTAIKLQWFNNIKKVIYRYYLAYKCSYFQKAMHIKWYLKKNKKNIKFNINTNYQKWNIKQQVLTWAWRKFKCFHLSFVWLLFQIQYTL